LYDIVLKKLLLIFIALGFKSTIFIFK